MFEQENIDDETYNEGMELQKKLGVRWNNRDWGVFRTSRVTEREGAARKEKLQAELKPVKMTARADTLWARKLDPITANDSQEIRNQKRIYDATEEAKRFEKEKAPQWEAQTEAVLKGSRWG